MTRQIKYTYNPMLVLVEKKPNQKPNKDDKKIIIELDNITLEKKTKFLPMRSIYSLQLKAYLEEISVSDLCDRLNIPRKSFYRYFSSKDGALFALLDHTLMEFETFSFSLVEVFSVSGSTTSTT